MRPLFLFLILFAVSCKPSQEVDCADTILMFDNPTLARLENPDINHEYSAYQSCSEFLSDMESRYQNSSESFMSQCSIANLSPTEDQPANTQPTNVQVSGVDEADRLKITDDYIFYAKPNAIQVIARQTLKPLVEINHGGGDRANLVTTKDFLIAVVSVNSDRVKSKVLFYSLSDLILSHEAEVLGGINAIRLSEDETLTLVTQQYFLHSGSGKNIEIPQSNQSMNCQNIHRFKFDSWSTGLAHIHSFSINKNQLVHNTQSFVGNYFEIYMNKSLYLTQRIYTPGQVSIRPQSLNVSVRFRYDDEAWAPKNVIQFPGKTLGSWSYFEKDHHFFVATTDFNHRESTSGLYVFENHGDKTLPVTSITGLAPTEELRSVRFTEDYAYLVTFRLVDPLFVIDIAHPEELELLGELKVPGFSSYMYPTSQGRLLGFGFSEDTEKVQLSLFDVQAPDQPKALQQILVGESLSTSISQWDHRSFFYSADWSLMGFPVSYRKSYYDLEPETGALIFDIGNDRFHERAFLSHKSWRETYCQSQEYKHSDQDIHALYQIDQKLMAFSDFGFSVHDRVSPEISLSQTEHQNPQNSCLRTLSYGVW